MTNRTLVTLLRYLAVYVAMLLYAWFAWRSYFPALFLGYANFGYATAHTHFEGYMLHCALLSAVVLVFLHLHFETLKQVAPANRKLQPVTVWLILLPELGFLLILPYVIVQLSRSLHAEFLSRGMDAKPYTTMILGLLGWGIYLLVIVLILFVLKPTRYFKSDAWAIFMVVYWARLAIHRNKLKLVHKAE